MKTLIVLTSCFLNFSMAAQWNSNKISDEPWEDENNSLTFTPKNYSPLISKPPVIQNDIALDLFPDPSGIVSVPAEDIQPQTNVCVYDALGKCVHDEVIMKKTELEIDLSSQPKGVYRMEIRSGDEKTTRKIVVQ